jgi:diguanylate cyclase (GGDEF)-like protein
MSEPLAAPITLSHTLKSSATIAELDWLQAAVERMRLVTRAVADSTSFRDLLKALCEAAMGIGGAESVGIYLTDPELRWFTVGWEATQPDWPNTLTPGSRIPLSDWPSTLSVLQSLTPRAWLRTDPGFTEKERARLESQQVGAQIDVPLVYGGRVLGFLNLFRRELIPFETRDIELSSAVAATMSLAIASERSLEQATRQSRDQKSLAQIAQAAITQRDPRELLQRVADELRAVLPFESISVELWTPALDRCETVGFATRPDWPHPEDFTEVYRLSDWPTNLRMLREQTFVTIDIEDDLSPHERGYLAERNLKQLHYAPLIYGDTCLGAILFQDSVRFDFDTDMRQLVNEAAAITSLAAHAARSLRQSLRERREQTWQLRVNNAVLNGASLATVVDEAAAALLEIAGAESCSTTIIFPDREEPLENRFSVAGAMKSAQLRRSRPSTWPITLEATGLRRQMFATIDEGSVGAAEAERLTKAKQGWIVVEPLVDGEKVLGQMVLTIPEANPPNDEALAFVRSTARQVAVVAFDHVMRIERERTTRTLSAMLKVTQSAVAGNDLNTMLRDIASNCLTLEDVDGCEIEFYDAVNRRLLNNLIVFSGEWKYEYNESGVSSVDDWPTWREVVVTGVPRIVIAEEGVVSPSELHFLHSVGAASLLIVPMAMVGDVTGLITLYRATKTPFPAYTVDAARELAGQASLALERVRLFDALRARADTDGVTGLLNHRAILELIDKEVNRAWVTQRPVSLLMVDLDSFKLFNDTNGHLAGDRYLFEIAQLIRSTMPADAEIARHGGDEFLILLPNTGISQAKALAKSLLAAGANASFEIGAFQVPFLFSIGSATAPHDGWTRDHLIRQADLAMYDAKEHGGGQLGHSREEVIELPLSTFSVLEGLVQAVDRKDHYTRLHSDRVTAVAVRFATWLGRSEEELEALYIAGQLHDVGKIAVPDSVLRRPGRLTPDELQLLRQHVTFSELMVKDVPHLEQVIAAISAHHERWNGTGYPRGLAGEAIPELGRVLAVADAFSAMTQDRPYLKARPHAEAIEEIRVSSGTQFQPELAEAFIEFSGTGALEITAPVPIPAILRAMSSNDRD